VLEEYKKIYREIADIAVPNWETINKNELIREAIVNKNSESFDGYMSAIILKYWNKMCSYYYKCRLVITPEDAHAWVVQSILYAIENQPWTKEDSSIYNDKNGPDKVVTRYLECLRLTFYQQLNRYNRKVNSLALSLENLAEDYLDAYTPKIEEDSRLLYKDMIENYFNKKEYIKSFILDIILYDYDMNKNFSRKRLVTMLRSLDNSYYKIFSKRYNIEETKVQNAVQKTKKLTLHKLKNLTELILIQLKEDLGEVIL
jgi:hypothetical protein